MRLTYCRAWKIKEKAKERIYGQPKNYYKLLPWMCERIVQSNPRSVVVLTYSSDGNFEQLFIAHDVSIQGLMGCRLIGPMVVPYSLLHLMMPMATCFHLRMEL